MKKLSAELKEKYGKFYYLQKEEDKENKDFQNTSKDRRES